MTEMEHRSHVAVGASGRMLSAGSGRCYLRVAVMGDQASRFVRSPARDRWPEALRSTIARAHDVSWCDASTAGATTYDVRRVQLREVAAHRPHLVALDAGWGELGRRDWDVSEVRAHLTHCARVLTQRGALVLTAGPGRGGRWHRSRADQLDEVYDELARRFGTVHVDRQGSPSATAARVAEALAGRGLDLPR